MSGSSRRSVPDAGHRFNNDLRYGDGDHPRQWHLTPPYVLDLVRADLGGVIDLDPCTFDDNPTGAWTFWTVSDDGLSKPWKHAQNIFVNPPYGKAREPWVDKCIVAAANGSRVILLIPAATETRIFQKAMRDADAVVFVRGRIKFGSKRENGRQHAASHPSALLGWRTSLTECASLGVLCRKDKEQERIAAFDREFVPFCDTEGL